MTQQPDLVRRELIETSRTLVVKIGTNVLSRPDDSLDVDRIAAVAEQIHRVRQTGRQVVVVSSGAIGAGMGLLGLKQRPTDLPHLQAAAAAGQAHLVRLCDDGLRKHGYLAAQVLLDGNAFKVRHRYLNVRNTLMTLFEYGAVPIINENDAVSVAEIKFSDNDHLAAMVTNLMSAPLLVILSVIDGLYDGDPGNADSRVIPVVSQWDDSLLELASGNRSQRGTGGMRSKLLAIRTAGSVGESGILADGTKPGILEEVLNGEAVGTLFLAKGRAVPAWKRWIGFTVHPKGRLLVDQGARKAVELDGRSLLPIGIAKVEGEFSRGEVVAICDLEGNEFARGLSNYNSADTRLIAGRRSLDIASALKLPTTPYNEVIHRNHLAITR